MLVFEESIVFGAWLAGAAGVAGVWLFRFIMFGRSHRRRNPLSSDSAHIPPGPAPRVSVLVAAKDEEDNIEVCLRTLLDMDYPDFEVIAVDDRSTDRTAAILARMERTHPDRLRGISVKELTPGWFGKNNAMRIAVEAATGEWLMFTDADCRQTSARTLSVAMAEAAEHDVDFLTIIPNLEVHAWWDRIIQPVCSLTLILWFLPERVNRTDNKTAYANGAFMLMKRTCYDGIGGHERVRTEVNEDIKMARFAKRGGFHLRVVENADLYCTRMYRTLQEAWRGWSRIFYGSLGTLRRLGISMLMIAVYDSLPWVSLFIAAAGSVRSTGTEQSRWMAAGAVWLGVIALQQIAMARYFANMGVGRRWSLGYVLGAVGTFAMLVNACFKVLGATPTTWRGTTYRGARLECAPATSPADIVAEDRGTDGCIPLMHAVSEKQRNVHG